MIQKIDLKLTVREFASLFAICHDRKQDFESGYTFRPDEIALAEYSDELERRVHTWSERKPSNEYKFSMRLSVAMTIWLGRTHYRPDNMLLGKIDKALVDLKITPFVL
ncbi:hypothetical protein BWI97_07305 [Siphonobacter sp. BAB-5405]|uniref:hypothetical protein n=1 Tax=Siphonobacter sp. BAB-5405 TaxID=1864825 RepID=UPI000C800C80|nr:hypothetical protein [Siphonobacter sp. BAB-5405]PMD97430.1 hypothetical protein BWI97_07305 [Siphonobacter sp. BAB-5405]